jgi:hypothetical protein
MTTDREDCTAVLAIFVCGTSLSASLFAETRLFKSAVLRQAACIASAV